MMLTELEQRANDEARHAHREAYLKLREAAVELAAQARDPIIPSEHGFTDAPTPEQWRHFNYNYGAWFTKLLQLERALRAVRGESE
jgi:hypothetical protein